LDLLLTEALPLIMGDPSQIVQVVLNLVINASEAIIDGGNVVVATSLWDGEAPSLEETILSNPLTPGEYVCIQVEDTGCGITPENAQRIFEPFFTTKFAGRGIGMSVVSGVVHRHQGTISIDSSVGQGTTFRVLLPAIDAHRLDYINPKRSSAAEETDASSQANILDLGAILVVDDEKTVRFAMQAVLEAVGFRTLAAECGEEAIATIQQADQEISLILLDVTMPGLSIDATIAGMREYRSDIPIVLMSGHHERDLAALMEENAIADFLPKPLGKPVDVVRKVLSTG
jgi:CheY-like chemotaxis protein